MEFLPGLMRMRSIGRHRAALGHLPGRRGCERRRQSPRSTRRSDSLRAPVSSRALHSVRDAMSQDRWRL